MIKVENDGCNEVGFSHDGVLCPAHIDSGDIQYL